MSGEVSEALRVVGQLLVEILEDRVVVFSWETALLYQCEKVSASARRATARAVLNVPVYPERDPIPQGVTLASGRGQLT